MDFSTLEELQVCFEQEITPSFERARQLYDEAMTDYQDYRYAPEVDVLLHRVLTLFGRIGEHVLGEYAQCINLVGLALKAKTVQRPFHREDAELLALGKMVQEEVNALELFRKMLDGLYAPQALFVEVDALVRQAASRWSALLNDSGL